MAVCGLAARVGAPEITFPESVRRPASELIREAVEDCVTSPAGLSAPLTLEMLLHEFFPAFVLFQVTSAAEEILGQFVAANSVRSNKTLRRGRKDERVMSPKASRPKKKD